MRIAYNVKEMRPGCVLLQAVLGGTVPNFSDVFDSQTWTTSPDGLQLFEVDEEELKKIAAMTKDFHRPKKPKGGKHGG